MSDALGGPVKAGSTTSFTFTYTRVVSLLLLAAGLLRACLILGLNPEQWSFATLDSAWRAATVTLVFLDLFAAVGLWIGATWGPVMWAVALTVEVSMYTIFSHIFGFSILRVLIHLALFGGFLALSILDWRREIQE